MTATSPKTLAPRTEAGRALAEELREHNRHYHLDDSPMFGPIAAIEQEAAEPYRRVVEAARNYVAAISRFGPVMARVERGRLLEALAALPVVVKDEADT